jgi:peptidoglycan/LPS O-acetylase OafA/YrhL
MVNSSQGNQVLILESYLLWPQRLAPLLAVAWTLTHEMYFYFVFTAMLWGPRRHIPGYLLAWLALVVVGDLVTGPQSDPLQKVVFHPLTLEFIAGCLVAIIIFKGFRGYGRTFFFVGTLLWIANMLGCHLLWAHALPAGWYRVLFFGLPCTLMVYGAVASEFQASLRFPKWLYAVGDASYSIYLSHILILSFIGRIWYRLGQKGLVDNIVMIAAMILMVVVYGHLSYRYIEKPLIHRFRRFAATVF